MARPERNKLITWAKAEGWTPRRRSSGHLSFTHPKTKHIIFVSSTTSDYRGLLNAKSDLKRALRSTEMVINAIT